MDSMETQEENLNVDLVLKIVPYVVVGKFVMFVLSFIILILLTINVGKNALQVIINLMENVYLHVYKIITARFVVLYA